MATREEIIAGLREMADWLEATPEAPVSSWMAPMVWCPSPSKESLVALAKAAGGISKKYQNNTFELRKDFAGGVFYLADTRRENVCTKRVVGTKKVEVQDPQLLAEVPKIEVDEDIVEWDCHPLLQQTTNED